MTVHALQASAYWRARAALRFRALCQLAEAKRLDRLGRAEQAAACRQRIEAINEEALRLWGRQPGCRWGGWGIL